MEFGLEYDEQQKFQTGELYTKKALLPSFLYVRVYGSKTRYKASYIRWPEQLDFVFWRRWWALQYLDTLLYVGSFRRPFVFTLDICHYKKPSMGWLVRSRCGCGNRSQPRPAPGRKPRAKPQASTRTQTEGKTAWRTREARRFMLRDIGVLPRCIRTTCLRTWQESRYVIL